jgi:hypothetical protein
VDRTQHALSNYVAPDHPDCEKSSKTALAAKVRNVARKAYDILGLHGRSRCRSR